MTLTAAQIALYAGALFVLFLTPGPVWLALTARTLGHGIRGAVPLMFGVAIGDVVWSLLAILGLAWIVGAYDWVMDALRWLAVLVFAGMGLMLLRHADKRIDADTRLNRPGQWAGFVAGLAAILANPKAILFYMGMLPGFFDLTEITATDILLIALISMIVPLIGNFGFAAFVDRARLLIASPHALKRTNQVAGLLLILVAVVIAIATP
jgi:threonine/homoserine/homoserine lactone efflux protein